MIEKFLKIINDLDETGDSERTGTFCNEVAEMAYNIYGLNVVYETEVQNCFHEALNKYFIGGE